MDLKRNRKQRTVNLADETYPKNSVLKPEYIFKIAIGKKLKKCHDENGNIWANIFIQKVTSIGYKFWRNVFLVLLLTKHKDLWFLDSEETLFQRTNSVRNILVLMMTQDSASFSLAAMRDSLFVVVVVVVVLPGAPKGVAGPKGQPDVITAPRAHRFP